MSSSAQVRCGWERPAWASGCRVPTHPQLLRTPLAAGVPPRWSLLKTRLEAVCPSGTDSLAALYRWKSVPKEAPPFLLQVASYDRAGMLHSLTHALWEADTQVFKAHITTSPSGDVADMFWL